MLAYRSFAGHVGFSPDLRHPVTSSPADLRRKTTARYGFCGRSIQPPCVTGSAAGVRVISHVSANLGAVLLTLRPWTGPGRLVLAKIGKIIRMLAPDAGEPVADDGTQRQRFQPLRRPLL